jgi:hypothetical protein
MQKPNDCLSVDVQIDAIWKFAAERLESIRKQPLK